MHREHLAAAAAAARRSNGAAAERLAARFLESRGLALLARNYRCRLGELDIVCGDGGVLVVVEVRQRSGTAFGGALASVTAAKRRRIERATTLFLLRTRRWRDAPVRFDVIAIEGPPDESARILWLKDAFRCGEDRRRSAR